MGVKYLEHVGEMRVENHATKEYCTVTFKEADANFFRSRSETNCVKARCFNASGKMVRELVGKWSESLSQVMGNDHDTLLWKAKQIPPDSDDSYGFSQFAVELNEITELERGKLPSTDTRNRPDQRFFENGKNIMTRRENLVSDNVFKYRKSG